MLKVYQYDNCGTCRKAKKWLQAHDVPFRSIPIRETPPTKAELKQMLAAQGGDFRKLFNTSGGDYKEMGLKDRLPKMTEAEALDLLSTRGNLVKRPFVLGEGVALVGFKEEEWQQAFLS